MSESSRRGFFREAARAVVAPLSDYLETHVGPTTRVTALRPPGAIEESQFVDVCARCGACVEACPADAIYPLGTGADRAVGTPAIDADLAACVVCDGLLCTHACPSGALRPLFSPHDIRMGLAEVYETLCVRSHGETCTLCVERCPIGESAIRFDGPGPPLVSATACVGCGVCQLACPTTPKAVVVRPVHAVGG